MGPSSENKAYIVSRQLSSVAVVLALALPGCKLSTSDSATKSLDNYSSKDGSKLTFNSCSGSYASSAPEGRLMGAAREIEAMRTALTAVPVELQSAFFQDLKGTIKVAKDLAAACGAKPSPGQRADDLLACWRGGESGIAIMIKAENDDSLTERNIKHSLVRMMGYVLTDVILKVKRSAGDAAIAENPSLASMKKDVADALTADTEQSKDSRISPAIRADRTKYENAAFAEGFDSYYCSAASRSKMEESFPNVYSLFGEIADALPKGLAGKLGAGDSNEKQAAPQPEASKSEFSLWGRWGWGGGPLRQTFSNWRDYRSDGGGVMNFRRWNNGGGLFFR
ncbi:MAG: hypothetical protein WCO71_01455 [Pseudomonadota bacterium]